MAKRDARAQVGGRVPRGRVAELARSTAISVVAPVRFSHRSGHWRSALLRRAVDRDGAAIPWYSYPLVDLLNQRGFEGLRVLEIGGGQSTWWWAARAEQVITIESDAAWYAELVAAAPDNVELVNVPVDTETRDTSGISRALDGLPPFDVVVIDGHLREECARLTWPLLAERGALIFDNSDGFNFQAVSAEWGAQRVDFYGYSAGSSRKTCSSVAFKETCFLFDAGAPIPSIK